MAHQDQGWQQQATIDGLGKMTFTAAEEKYRSSLPSVVGPKIKQQPI
jgi:hypothetical protein